jgi:hypothetical protein
VRIDVFHFQTGIDASPAAHLRLDTVGADYHFRPGFEVFTPQFSPDTARPAIFEDEPGGLCLGVNISACGGSHTCEVPVEYPALKDVSRIPVVAEFNAYGWRKEPGLSDPAADPLRVRLHEFPQAVDCDTLRAPDRLPYLLALFDQQDVETPVCGFLRRYRARRPPSRHYDIVAVFQSPLPPREQLKFCCQPFIRSGRMHVIVGIFFIVGLPYL